MRQRKLSAGLQGSGRAWLVGAGVLIVLVFAAFHAWSRWPVPQMQTNERVFNTVDALFTAITARDATRLSECEQRLRTYHADGFISDAVSTRIDAAVQQAHAGDWDSAAHDLYDFILAQQGET